MPLLNLDFNWKMSKIKIQWMIEYQTSSVFEQLGWVRMPDVQKSDTCPIFELHFAHPNAVGIFYSYKPNATKHDCVWFKWL